MRPGDNIIDLLQDPLKKEVYGNRGAHKTLFNKMVGFKKKPFVIFFQPGAGAPVSSFMEEWMKANLGGCTGEICAMRPYAQEINFLIVNSMTPAEQAIANASILANKQVNIAELEIINDPNKILFDFLQMTPADIKTVNDRTAYLPQAYIFDEYGMLKEVIRNIPQENGKARESKKYLEEVIKAVQALPVHDCEYDKSVEHPKKKCRI